MATIHVVLARVRSRSDNGDVLPVQESVEGSAETMTSTASTAQSSLTANDRDVWSVTASGGKVWLKFGANPTAVSGAGWLLLDGQTREFAASASAEKLAIKDA